MLGGSPRAKSRPVKVPAVHPLTCCDAFSAPSGNDGVVDGVPVTAQLASHVRNRPTGSADLNRYPAGRPIRQHPSSGASLDASEPTVGVVTAALGSRKPE